MSIGAPAARESVDGRHEGAVIAAILMFAFVSSAALLTRHFPILPNGLLVISPEDHKSAQGKSAQMAAATRD
jgi:hypothetical protein